MPVSITTASTIARKASGWTGWRSINGLTAAEVGAFTDGRRLGYAKLSNCAYENADGSPVSMDKDYSGASRQSCTFAGPFGTGTVSTMKVW